jgi:hypothetical protein
VDLHWGADDLGSRERLTRALRRERLKDTGLDYGFGRTEAGPEIRGESRDSVRTYAEPRGLVPESEIVLREQRVEPKYAEPARKRRGLFAGLKLDAGRGMAQGAADPQPPPPALTERQHQEARLEEMVAHYARA